MVGTVGGSEDRQVRYRPRYVRPGGTGATLQKDVRYLQGLLHRAAGGGGRSASNL